jgi:FkbM family methyltransferase
MTFISYAQNFEDVMLWRALKHIPNGTYIDVGAQDPIIDSVSKAFYERGWRGVHVEPVPHYAELLRKDRPDETVLQIALGDFDGVIELNVIPNTGLTTAVDAYAKRHHTELNLETRRLQVPIQTLKSALASLVGQEIHWLKIDVEGFEEQVLKGWDSTILRPWIMIIEATIPNSPQTDHLRWEPLLIAADYQYVYFDGLNRFYVAAEHTELVSSFSAPPNFFDYFQPAKLNFLQNERDQAKEQLQREKISSSQQVAQLKQQLQHEKISSSQQVAQLKQQLHDIYSSKSWKITLPLRTIMQIIKNLFTYLLSNLKKLRA